MSFVVKDLQNTALALSPTKNIISVKIGLENVLAAYWLMGFNYVLNIFNNPAETCIILLKVTSTGAVFREQEEILFPAIGSWLQKTIQRLHGDF